MFWIFLLGIIGLVVWSNVASKSKEHAADMEFRLKQRNQEWVDFIAAYAAVAKTAKEKALVVRMIRDIAAQDLGRPSNNAYLEELDAESALAEPAISSEEGQVPTAALRTDVTQQPGAISRTLVMPKVELDNTSLLLYFGAFLFVAAVGLFIGFGGASGGLRTFAVAVVLAVMYSGGMWLYNNRPKLRQAAYTFSAIGIVIAPLVGVAAYNYLFTKQHGMLIWLVTSLFCLGLYTHAFLKLQQPLLSYLLIFTFLSLFESGVGVIAAPVYYYGWGLAFVAILLQLLGRWKGYWPSMEESSHMSSTIMLPISILVAIAMVPQHGSLQLGVSLLLGAIFYGLEITRTVGDEQAGNAVASQALAIAGIAAVSYGVGHRWIYVVQSLLVTNLLQIALMWYLKVNERLWYNFGSVLMVAGVTDIALSITQTRSLFAATLVTAIVALAVWVRQRRTEAYALAVLSFAALPYLYGQLLHTPALSAAGQTFAGIAVLFGLLLYYIYSARTSRVVSGWSAAAQSSYILAAIAVVVSSFFATPYYCLAICVAIATSMILLAELEHEREWADIAALFLLAPLVRSWDNKQAFLVSTAIALGIVIIMALRYRRELLRWVGTVLWLLLPIGLGRGAWGPEWTTAEYAWTYMVAMYGLLFARSIARGVVFLSTKVPLASLARTASLSYVTGYVFSATLAVAISFADARSQLHTTLILIVLLLTAVLTSVKVEKRKDTLAVAPLLAQAVVLSWVRPQADGSHISIFLLWSTAVAVVSYFVAGSIRQGGNRLGETVDTALVTAFVAPATVFFVGYSQWLMPFGLLVAGGLLCHRVWQSTQAAREVAGSVIAAAVLWFMAIWHIHFVQAYSHTIVLLFALYAYWRTKRGELAVADNYLWAMIITATLPLAVQAINGDAGGLYGYWLLLEEIAIMLLGMLIGKRFVIRWGLYTALAAVLYQLRGLGYAALAVLALFLIGLAIFQLQRHDSPKQ